MPESEPPPPVLGPPLAGGGDPLPEARGPRHGAGVPRRQAGTPLEVREARAMRRGSQVAAREPRDHPEPLAPRGERLAPLPRTLRSRRGRLSLGPVSRAGGFIWNSSTTRQDEGPRRLRTRLGGKEPDPGGTSTAELSS